MWLTNARRAPCEKPGVPLRWMPCLAHDRSGRLNGPRVALERQRGVAAEGVDHVLPVLLEQQQHARHFTLHDARPVVGHVGHQSGRAR
jgi:hypothetical protein